MKKNPLGCRTVWLNSSTTRWTTGRKLKIHTQQKTQAGIDSVRTQLLVQGTSPLPKGAKTWEENWDALVLYFCFVKKNILGFIFFPLPACSMDFISRVLFLWKEKASTVTPFVPLLPAESNLREENILMVFFLFVFFKGELCSPVTRVL